MSDCVKTQEITEEGNTRSSSVRARKWAITLNNYTKEEYDNILTHFTHKTQYVYIIGKEVGEQGTPHLQMYVESKNAISLASLKKIIPRGHMRKPRELGNRIWTIVPKRMISFRIWLARC